MNQPENRNNWYDQTDLNAWYTQQPEPAAAPAPEKKKRKKHTGMKVTMIVVCVLILVAATALLASGGFGWNFTVSVDGSPSVSSGEKPALPSASPKPDEGGSPDGDSDGSSGGVFGDLLPDNGSGITDSDGDGYPDDYTDFFNNFYVSAEETLPSNLETTIADPGLSLELVSSEGKEKLTYAQLYDKCINSIVGVMALYEGVDGYGWGSGVIFSADGYIITNSHVISEADSAIVVLSDGSEYEAKLVGEDTQSDIAVLKIEATGLVPAEFGKSSELNIGDDVVAIGNPLGVEFSGTLTNGIISAIDRDMDYNGATMTLLQTNAAINEGNSGGPLINMYGQVIGITNMKMVNTTSATIEGIGFAIPSNTVKEIADQLIVKGKVTGRPGIGITCGMVPEAAAEHYGLVCGLYIISVVPESDAAAKGVQAGDILTHINGTPVYTTDDVLAIRDECSVGDILTFTIFRNGQSFDVDVELYDQNDLK